MLAAASTRPGETLDRVHDAEPDQRDPRAPRASDPSPDITRRVSRTLVTAVGLIVLVSVVGVVIGFDALAATLGEAWSLLKKAPAPVYFGVASVLIALPIPASILYATAGPIYGVVPSILWIVPTLVVNSLLVHAIGSTSLRPALRRMVARRGSELPRFESRSDQLFFTTLARVTPGVPYFLQSWAIVLAGVDRTPFVLISVAVQIFYATGFVLLGRSAFEGRLGTVAVAIAFLVAAGLGARLLHVRLQRRPEPTDRRSEHEAVEGQGGRGDGRPRAASVSRWPNASRPRARGSCSRTTPHRATSSTGCVRSSPVRTRRHPPRISGRCRRTDAQTRGRAASARRRARPAARAPCASPPASGAPSRPGPTPSARR